MKIELLQELLNSKAGVRGLKILSVELQQYELASNLRELELKKYPDTRENEDYKQHIEKLQTALRLIDINCDLTTTSNIYQIMKTEDLENLTVKDVKEMVAKSKFLFR